MKDVFFKLVIFILTVTLYGCSTPSGMKWQKADYSTKSTNADVSDCKVNTALWWPFDTLSRCMHRRGYKLIGENEITTNYPNHNMRVSGKENETYIKLIELKKLKDDGIISEEEFKLKKAKYLSEY